MQYQVSRHLPRHYRLLLPVKASTQALLLIGGQAAARRCDAQLEALVPHSLQVGAKPLLRVRHMSSALNPQCLVMQCSPVTRTLGTQGAATIIHGMEAAWVPTHREKVLCHLHPHGLLELQASEGDEMQGCEGLHVDWSLQGTHRHEGQQDDLLWQICNQILA